MRNNITEAQKIENTFLWRFLEDKDPECIIDADYNTKYGVYLWTDVSDMMVTNIGSAMKRSVDNE